MHKEYCVKTETKAVMGSNEYCMNTSFKKDIMKSTVSGTQSKLEGIIKYSTSQYTTTDSEHRKRSSLK